MDFLSEILNAVNQSELPVLFMLALMGVLVALGYTVKSFRVRPKEDEKPVEGEPPKNDGTELIKALVIVAEELQVANRHNTTQLTVLVAESTATREVIKTLTETLSSLKTNLTDTIVTAHTRNIENHDTNANARFVETVKKIDTISNQLDELGVFIKEKLYQAIERAKTVEEISQVTGAVAQIHKDTGDLASQLQQIKPSEERPPGETKSENENGKAESHESVEGIAEVGLGDSHRV